MAADPSYQINTWKPLSASWHLPISGSWHRLTQKAFWISEEPIRDAEHWAQVSRDRA